MGNGVWSKSWFGSPNGFWIFQKSKSYRRPNVTAAKVILLMKYSMTDLPILSTNIFINKSIQNMKFIDKSINKSIKIILPQEASHLQ